MITIHYVACTNLKYSMAQTTNYAEIQQDELEALRSIYMQDFEENEMKTGAWNVGYNMPENQRPSDDMSI